MNSRGLISAAIAVAACSISAFAQLKAPNSSTAMPMGRAGARAAADAIASGQSRVLWIRNDMTGQVIQPGATLGRKAADDPAPIYIYNNFDNPNGVAGINLNWNYKEAYTISDFSPPIESDPLNFGFINISSDPTDPDDQFLLVGGEKLALLFEPYHALTWPDPDLNTRQTITEYTSVVSSYSQQFEIRVCRIYFFSLNDVTQPFDSALNPYKLELQLSFAFVSFAFQAVQSAFSFDLSGFDPPLTIKGDGLVLTHWKKISQPPPCYADLNEDGLVEDADFVLFLAQYNILDCADETMPNFCSADLNFDGFVDDSDFQIFVQAYNDLLCPAPFVIRGAYAPLAGGRFRWDNDDNLPSYDPLSFAIANPTGWPFPSPLVTVPNLGTGPYPDPFAVGCSALGCEPSFLAYFSTLTGFHFVNELNMDATDLKTEYERFMNEIAVNQSSTGSMRSYSIFDVKSFIDGGLANTDWVPSSTPKRFSITPPKPTK
ncbi:MAG: hypothetical protein ACREJD_08730 [Phycisphaerales bacterium]